MISWLSVSESCSDNLRTSSTRRLENPGVAWAIPNGMHIEGALWRSFELHSSCNKFHQQSTASLLGKIEAEKDGLVKLGADCYSGYVGNTVASLSQARAHPQSPYQQLQRANLWVAVPMLHLRSMYHRKTQAMICTSRWRGLRAHRGS